ALLTESRGTNALLRILWGLAKKVIGDLLGQTVNDGFSHSGMIGPTRAWICALALAGQYYADFSGYSDVAIGLGQFLGLRLPENFRTPFLATSVADHWRRWNITVSGWFHEYVFVPICFIRWPRLLRSKWARSLPLGIGVLSTMALIGVWHGFSWNNLIW